MKRIIRQILGWGMMLTLPLMMTSCGELFDMLDNPITPALQVLRAQLTLKVGESKPLRASTQDHVVLLYSSDNPAVATVDATGLISAVSPGTARITIKAQGEDDYYRTEIFSENTTTVEVTVNKGDGSISYANADVTKNYGDAKFVNQLTIVGDGTVSYSSSNEEVATVNPATGDVTIVDGGKVTITATTTSTDNYVYETTAAKYTLNIYRLIDLSTLTADFTAKDNYILTGTLAGNYKISIADNANIELKDATINSADVNDDNYRWAGLTCKGNANITITGTNTIRRFCNSFSGIQAGKIGTTLTIDGTGLLTAIGGNYASGIGSGQNASCGSITINGGTINANSTDDGSGIGSGQSYASCGNITINGGTVNARSRDYGAGIGSGNYYSTCGKIIINDGIINASSGGWGAGIGSGNNQSNCDDITIYGGDITAYSSQEGAGIGSGNLNSQCSNIIIYGGSINAYSSQKGAGIGSGSCESSCGAITISGGTVIASSGDAGAGIGSGSNSTFGSITITSGITQVQATTNYTDAWPIGKGYLDQSSSSSAVTIAGVTVTGRDWTSTSLPGLNFATSGTGGTNLTWTLTPKVP